MRTRERPRGRVGALPVRVVGALAYLFLPAAVFLLLKPYKRNRFVRFHSLQSIGFFLTALVAMAALSIAGMVMRLIPPLPLLFLMMLVGLAFVVVWMVLVTKALQGEQLRLPLLSGYAERHALAG